MTTKASAFLGDKYYLVLKLPFGLMLVFRQSFSHLQDAEQFMTDYFPFFSLVTREEVDKWDGKILLVPVKKPKVEDTYVVSVTAKVAVKANSPQIAHTSLRGKLQRLGMTGLKTRITGVRKGLDL